MLMVLSSKVLMNSDDPGKFYCRPCEGRKPGTGPGQLPRLIVRLCARTGGDE